MRKAHPTKVRRIEHGLDDLYIVEHRNCPDSENKSEFLMAFKMDREKGIGKQWTTDIRDSIFFPHREGASNVAVLVCIHGRAKVLEIELVYKARKAKAKR
jgi:hypothetical protein